jgi:triosephosphate isomerase
MNTRKPVIAGNWKMYKTLAETRAFAEAFPAEAKRSTDPEVILCPPFTVLNALAESLKGTAVQVGGQDVYWQDEGAYTGEVSPVMLKDAGASHVIIGHSERRQYFGETDGSVNRKVQAALQWQLTPIICVGEKLEEREAGLTDNVVIVQVQRALLNVAPELVSGVLFAYEPVWAIGTGKTCAADEANRVCGLIRETIAKMAGREAADQVRVLYGGSVKPETIAEQMAQPEIDGALVGGASLDPASFAKIVGFRTTAAR